MRWKRESIEWKKRYALLPTCVRETGSEETYVWLEWYETRWLGPGKHEDREIGSDYGYVWDKMTY